MKFHLSQRISSLDLYGHTVGVNFKGRGTFGTCLGGVCTTLTWILLTYHFTILLIAFYTGSKQNEKFSIAFFDRFYSEKFYLAENGFEISTMGNI